MDRIDEIMVRMLDDIHKKEEKNRAALDKIDQALKQTDESMDSVHKTQSGIEELLGLL